MEEIIPIVPHGFWKDFKHINSWEKCLKLARHFASLCYYFLRIMLFAVLSTAK